MILWPKALDRGSVARGDRDHRHAPGRVVAVDQRVAPIERVRDGDPDGRAADDLVAQPGVDERVAATSVGPNVTMSESDASPPLKSPTRASGRSSSRSRGRRCGSRAGRGAGRCSRRSVAGRRARGIVQPSTTARPVSSTPSARAIDVVRDAELRVVHDEVPRVRAERRQRTTLASSANCRPTSTLRARSRASARDCRRTGRTAR